MSQLQVADATVRYGDTVALDRCSLTIEAGELIVVLGPSGCGKSTLLRAIAGLVPLDGGSVSIEGRDVTSLAPARRDVAMVFQGYALFPHLDVAGNIGFGLRARREPEASIRAQVAEVAGLLGIEALLQRRPHELSGGERQRVALARALVRAPTVALLDEPLANLDAPLRIAARGEIARLQRDRGTTMLHVTHDQSEAMALGHRIVVMRDGAVVQTGLPREVYDRPCDRFVATFVGSPPMNLLRGISPDEVIGVRPEHVTVRVADGREAEVTAIEGQGDHAIVTLNLDGELLLAKTSPEPGVAIGDRVRVGFSIVHRFDALTGERLG